jgi:preprotein translocase subunit SecF
MSFKIPNIYERKDLRQLIAIPIALLIIGLLLSTQTTYDTTLKGGVSIILQTNTQISSAALASQLSSKLGVVQPDIAPSPGGYQITITTNDSLAAAQSALINFYSYQANYSSYNVNQTIAEIGLQRNPNNQTLISEMSQANIGMNKSLSGMKVSLASEAEALKPFIGSVSYNSSSAIKMGNEAPSFYTNASEIYKTKVISTIKGIIPFTSYSYEQITPTLGSYFLSQVWLILITAFVLVSIVVFFIFRSPAPAFAVVFGAGNDMIIAIGAMALLKIPLGVASLGGLLMLIGYSIDTDMLTAVRIIKRKEGTPEENAYSAMQTGLTMTLTAIVSFAILFIVSLVAYVPTYYEISGVVLFGLIGDIFTTWFANAPMVLMWKRRKDRKHGS